VLDEFRALPIPEDVMELWLHGNAERLLGAPVPA
jgi:predicted TIM-barrel fold metal-dependent hydrolase